MTEEEREKACVIVSNHSLPEKIKQLGDPYEEQLIETARLIQEKTGLPNVEVGWQSAGQTPEPWLGPDVQDLTRELYKKRLPFVRLCASRICNGTFGSIV